MRAVCRIRRAYPNTNCRARFANFMDDAGMTSLLRPSMCIALLTTLSLCACNDTRWNAPRTETERAFAIATAEDLAATADLAWEDEAIYAHLEQFLTKHPEIFGSTYSLDPLVTGKPLAPYVYRVNGVLTRKDLTLNDYDYSHQPWFTQPITQNGPLWSEPYFDAGGGDIDMVTYSVPVVKDGKIIGVLTADFPVVSTDMK